MHGLSQNWCSLARQTCNVMYQNSNKVHVFCSSLSFQQARRNICMSNKSRVTAAFGKTVVCTHPENKGVRKKWTKKWEGCSTFQSMRSTGSFRINAHNIIVPYMPSKNFYAPGVAALCSVFHAVFVQVVVKPREHDLHEICTVSKVYFS